MTRRRGTSHHGATGDRNRDGALQRPISFSGTPSPGMSGEEVLSRLGWTGNSEHTRRGAEAPMTRRPAQQLMAAGAVAY